jgi:hypothetical protein
MVAGFPQEIVNMTDHRSETVTRHVHEGRYAADVEITYHYAGTDWDPTIALPDVQKLERVRLALRRGDIAAAAKDAKVFELLPLAGE